ncbi:hypothetical protein DOM21_01485 [Bacteriovorax stolpii]|uniref:Uncharacterized protein n=1 Tax=Bacteriovorax stolpii TaxID=960 RepID=A0A2K9NXR7_BACTC|nr:hypothetical protein [Bacteriovorax stolpii]AUN99855.1 hypothetical protein C0V70_17445 [Bacteriovorax stolpii]QDK40152.1 hypothetical protein DOM21_01485 [Bacteriovorax stolpii]TDP54253.1 hypothetical protein C8D79_1546 [Bacteriovorax stolpii]
MNKSFYLLPILLVTLISCSGMGKKGAVSKLPSEDGAFSYTDKNGEFYVRISAGLDKDNKNFSTKRVMEIPNRQKDKILEQSVAISTLGSVKKNIILRPKISQYNVWFDGKKYASELKINAAKKAIDLKMTSPESQWNGTKQVKFPSTKMLPCFFSQIIECAKVSGFISKASDKKSGSTKMLVIWEGYPYLNETFSDFPSELFSEAVLEYDGKTKESERRFNLRVAGQSIFYILNDKDVMIKMFWVSQGISMVSKSVAKETSAEDGGSFE